MLFLPDVEDFPDIHVVDTVAGLFVPGPLFGRKQVGVKLLGVDLPAFDGQVGFGIDGIAQVGELFHSSPMLPHEMVIRFIFPSFPAETSSQSLSIICKGFNSICEGEISCQGLSRRLSAVCTFWGVLLQLMMAIAANIMVIIFFIRQRKKEVF